MNLRRYVLPVLAAVSVGCAAPAADLATAATDAPAAPAVAPVQQEASQDAAPQQRAKGAIFKSPIDGLIRGLRQAAKGRDDRSLGGASVRATAKILAAIGHCHRGYHAAEGGEAWLRPSLQLLFEGRRADGSFADSGDADPVLTTAWVADALSVLHPGGYAQEIDDCRKWLAAHKRPAPDTTGSPWKRAVSAVLENVRPETYPEHLGAEAAGAVRSGQLMRDGAIDYGAAADALVQLVACQVANQQMDKTAAGTAHPWTAAQQRGFAFLLTLQEDGVFKVDTPMGKFADPGITAMGISALLTKPVLKRTKEEQAVIDQGIDWLLAQQNADGSFGQQTINYVTCAVVKALSMWADPKVRPVLLKAQSYILAIQNIEDQGYSRGDRDYGSIGYGGDERGDISNLQFALEALRETGLQADHEAFAKALVFLQRTQNLSSVNDFKGKMRADDGRLLDVVPGNDGGSAYYPGNSPAGYVQLPDGSKVPRSYGSMTYALLKSYTLAGIPGDDPRVKAAVGWIQNNWTLVENPGADPALGAKVKAQGLFYYYMVMAQALSLAGVDAVQVPGVDGAPAQTVPWETALRMHLEGMQRDDGSWVNAENDRWYEGLPLIATAYAMLALHHCR